MVLYGCAGVAYILMPELFNENKVHIYSDIPLLTQGTFYAPVQIERTNLFTEELMDVMVMKFETEKKWKIALSFSLVL